MSFKYGDTVMVNQLNKNHPFAQWSGHFGYIIGPVLFGYVSVDVRVPGSFPVRINIEVTDLTAVSPQASQYSAPKPKFKVGDRVVYKKGASERSGEVTTVGLGSIPIAYNVQFDDGGAWVYYGDDLTFEATSNRYSTPTGGTYTTGSGTYPIATWQGVYQAMTGHNPNEHLLSGIMTNLDTHAPYSTACECGVTKTFGEEAGTYLHSDWCPKYRKNPYGSEK